MTCFLGIDVGTSSVKSILMDMEGTILGIAQRKYDVQKPRADWAEQDADVLWCATKETLRELVQKYPRQAADLAGIGYSGQMHGLILTDESGRPVRPAIIWEDQRSIEEIGEIYRLVPPSVFNAVTMNTLSTGYLASSLMWVMRNEPQNYMRARHILLPKDYIRFKMCGEYGTDMSDASSAVIFDTAERTWANQIISRLGMDMALFPECHESYEIAGMLTEPCARATGLRRGIPVIYGGGDTLMHEVGTGMISPLRPWVANIGTSCQVTCAMNSPLCDDLFRTNTFCHVKEDLWMLMSCNLCGGAAMKWMAKNIFSGLSFGQLDEMAIKAPVGSDGLIFLPYLNGSRSPENDPRAKGMFMGINMSHTGAHFVRSTMEGVVYSLKNCMEVLKSVVHAEPETMIASGGGTRGKLFLQMEADAFNKPIYTTKEAEQSCVGAAATAAVGTGYFSSYEEACAAVVHFSQTPIEPIAEHVRIYEEYFSIYRELYGHNKDLFADYPANSPKE